MNMTKDDTELVLGSKMVYRRWEADQHGRLWGAHGGMWKPGVNVATCNYTHAAFTKERGYASPFAGCSCGFYGFYAAGETGYRYGYPITGVTEMTGQVIEGDRGVRAEKAEIKALVIRRPNHLVRWNNSIASRIHKVHGAEYFVTGPAIIAAVLLVSGSAGIFASGFITLGVLTILLTLVTLFVGVAGFRSIGFTENIDYQKVHAAYPDVRIFPSERAMLRVYPETKPPNLTPDSEEFWKLPK